MYPELEPLEARLGDRLGPALSECLGASVDVAVATHPLECAHLSPGELAIYRKLSSPLRRHQWLTGRRALCAVRARHCESTDTSGLGFPHPRYSLTHARQWAVAVGATDPTSAGVGVDFEPLHAVDPGTARFFLAGHELEWAKSLSPRGRARELLRLWTVKEAVFKADCANGANGLADYVVEDPTAWAGTARGLAKSGYRCRYATVDAPPQVARGGLITVAYTDIATP